MVKVYTLMSTGLPELDEVIQGVMPGDNIVWQVDSIDDYIRFVHPYVQDAYQEKHKLIYFRFAEHKGLLPDDVEAEVYKLHPEDGFETFISEIFTVIEKSGHGAFYIFDCLSELTVDWYSDRMVGNFFMLICPYLYDYDSVAYFCLLRNNHTTQTINAIHDTAQVIIDVYRNKQDIYIQPLKVFKRYSQTLYMLHHWKGSKFSPVTQSAVIAEIMGGVTHAWAGFSEQQPDFWNRVFARAQRIQEKVDQGMKPDKEYDEYRQRLLRMAVTRDEELLALADKYFDLKDLINIGRRMIGTGLIGGKAVGMLLSRAILEKKNPAWQESFEPHDSFFIGSDVFYTYLIKSKCWWVRWKQRHSENYLEGAEEAYNRMISGTFPEDIQNEFREVLNYFGQSPIIVRSSSLLEDAYGNAFSGKYESIFCPNQGTPEERLEIFMNAIKKVYASTMNQEALQYRYQRGLLDRDEQMALLVQRVSGNIYGKFFFPQVAGVGFSYNLYVWDKNIDPRSGVLRIVMGLGTRAVDRSDDDYTRIVAVNEPKRRPEASFDEVKRHAQRKMDLLNLQANMFQSDYFSDVAKNVPELSLELFVSKDAEIERMARERKMKDLFPYIITFDRLFDETRFIDKMREILEILQEAYDYPVDIEFTANFGEKGEFKINLLQCRPYQVKMGAGIVKEPGKIDEKSLILKTNGPIMGSSVHTVIDRLVFIVPAEYSQLSERDRYKVARTIGRITNLRQDGQKKTIMLLGPGRWGTATPALGVPVQFGDINNVSVLCELAEMHEGLIPDVSLGTHFFNDLVELDILYMAIHPRRRDNLINREFLAKVPNQLPKLLPDAAKWAETIRVLDLAESEKGYAIYLNVNSIEQRGICYRDKKD